MATNCCTNCGQDFDCSEEDAGKNCVYCPSCEALLAAYEAEAQEEEKQK